MNYYAKRKEAVRQEAIDWQLEQSEKSSSYMEIAEQSNRFENLGRRYGLLTEFRENGIL
jgi:hypothetical protein